MTRPPPAAGRATAASGPLGWLGTWLFIALLLAAWEAAVRAWAPALLPPPSEVAAELWRLLARGSLLGDVAVTLGRVGLAFACAMSGGIALGLLLGSRPLADRLLNPLLALALNVPALVVIFLCFIWIGLNDTAAITAVALNKAPNVAVSLREGAKAVDRELLAVARAFAVPPARAFRRVYLPQLQPYLLAAIRNGLPLVWKIILVVELVGCSDGVGFQLAERFQHFDIAGILAYTAAFMTVVFAIEALLLRPWERSVARWRP